MKRRGRALLTVATAWVLALAASASWAAGTRGEVPDLVFDDGFEAGVTCGVWTQTNSPEVCDGLDNDCNGVIDDGASEDEYEPNDSCANFISLAAVGSDGNQSFDQLTLFGAGDEDYYRIHAAESDATCSCCDGGLCLDEDYQLTVSLQVPAGAGSYRLCAGLDSCANADNFCVTVLAGAQDSVQLTLDGACSGADEYDTYVHVSGLNPPGSSCLPYTLSYTFSPGCF